MILLTIIFIAALLVGAFFAGIILASANDYKNEHNGNK